MTEVWSACACKVARRAPPTFIFWMAQGRWSWQQETRKLILRQVTMPVISLHLSNGFDAVDQGEERSRNLSVGVVNYPMFWTSQIERSAWRMWRVCAYKGVGCMQVALCNHIMPGVATKLISEESLISATKRVTILFDQCYRYVNRNVHKLFKYGWIIIIQNWWNEPFIVDNITLLCCPSTPWRS